MYNSQEIADNIKIQAKAQNIPVKKLLEQCELGKNTVGKIANGTDVGIATLCKIADYLDCSVDYLLGRTQKNNAPDNIRDAIIERINLLPDSKLDRLLGFLEGLAAE